MAKKLVPLTFEPASVRHD